MPSVPLSHPFVERLIGTLRRECVDQLLFWSASDLEDKLVAFQDFYNAHRAHASLDGRTPVPIRQGCRTARPLPMGRALPWSLSDADRGVTSDQRRRWRAGRRARVRRLSRHSRAVRQLHAFLMPSRQRRGGLPAHGTRRSNDVGFLRIRHPQPQRRHHGLARREDRRPVAAFGIIPEDVARLWSCRQGRRSRPVAVSLAVEHDLHQPPTHRKVHPTFHAFETGAFEGARIRGELTRMFQCLVGPL